MHKVSQTQSRGEKYVLGDLTKMFALIYRIMRDYVMIYLQWEEKDLSRTLPLSLSL